MASQLKIGFIVGSPSVASINLKLAKGLMGLLEGKAEATLIAIAHLPLYSRDMDASYPEALQAFKDQVHQQDGIVFVTPEYNRSISAQLKNALDAGTRPWGNNVWAGKPASVIGTSPGGIATGIAQQHLRNVLAAVGMPTMAQPEAFVRWKEGLVLDDGKVDDSSQNFLNGFLQSTLTWVASHRKN